ncbi:MAG TPA: Sec-independent protein translocase subunit TatA [Nocardioidaceae bacterium]|jgi:sec-independent protein translocase protein TatA|nr:Sec-independent protein translocase subunit TatA [Nocardioidaceae bacterium]
MSVALTPMIAGLGPTELLIILGVLILLFGAKKLPELARGSGRALRIFKAETKGLGDDEDDQKTPEQRQIEAHNRATQARFTETDPAARPQPPADTDR